VDELSKEADQLAETLLLEGGAAKLLRSLRGLEKNIHSMGIVTAWNPSGQKPSPADNNTQMTRLMAEVRAAWAGFPLFGEVLLRHC